MHIDKEHKIPFGCCACDKIPKTKNILKCTLKKSIKFHLDVVHVIKFQNEIYFKMHIDKEHETNLDVVNVKNSKNEIFLKCTLIKSMKPI